MGLYQPARSGEAGWAAAKKSINVIGISKDLVSDSTLALFRHPDAQHMSDGRRQVSLTDDALRLVALLETLASSDEDRRYRGAAIAIGGG